MLPSSGAYSIGQQNNIADRAAHLILPLAVVVLGHLWYYAYMIRNRLLDEMRADYVLLAKAKGLTRRAVMLRHCLRNTMPTYLSIMAHLRSPCAGRDVHRRDCFFLPRPRHAGL